MRLQTAHGVLELGWDEAWVAREARRFDDEVSAEYASADE